MGEHKSKKRKAESNNGTSKTKSISNGDLDVSSRNATRGRQYTVSVAVPGSIIAGAPTQELKTQLAGQIARALSIFCIDEVIIFEDGQSQASSSMMTANGGTNNSSSGGDEYTGISNPSHFLAHILAYLETPPYLRDALFPPPHHPNLQSVNIIPSLELPHHTASTDWQPFREAVSRGPSPADPSPHSLLDVGLDEPILVSGEIPESSRVTLRFPGPAPAKVKKSKSKTAAAEAPEAVGPTVPREGAGQTWGYQVRTASSLSAVITECAYDGGYDLTWGVTGSGPSSGSSSEQDPGQELSQALETAKATRAFFSDEIEGVRHMLLVLGNGPHGLEGAARADEELVGLGVAEEPHKLFDLWVKVPASTAGGVLGRDGAGVRTEEALWMVLTGLRDLVMC